MKIVNIVPGFGGSFYCGNCLRDSAYSTTMKNLGHDVFTLPLYLPLSKENNFEMNDSPIFYGAVNIYIEQKVPFLRKMPEWLHRFFNSPSILRYAAKKSGSTRASGLEEMTISMLNGAEGNQKKELNELIEFLRDHEKPDAIHLSNALLMGLANKIREELKIPVFCSLQDEDVWIDAMESNYQDKLWKLMREKAEDVDGFIAVSEYFADLMKYKMDIPDEKIFTVGIGIDPEKYTYHKPNTETPTIAYLSRSNAGNGFDILVDAFIHLKTKTKFSNAKLRVSGGMTADDRPFIKKQINKLKHYKIDGDIEFIEEFTTDKLSTFFEGTTLLSVPVPKGEAFGLYQLEAFSSGIPVVQPSLGAFPEIAERSGAGKVYSPNKPEELAKKWEEVLSDHDLLQQMSQNARKSVETIYNSKILANDMIEVYSKFIKS
jgi:glycosyltransferase involved in cell wall biosynthesis